MFLAVIAGALYTIQLKKLLGKYNPATLVIHMNAFGFVYFLPLFLYFEYNDFVQVEFDSRLIITLAELVIFSSVGALYFFSHAVEKIGVSKSSLFTNLIPVITAIAAWIILPDESLDLKLATGIVIVLFGVFIGQDRKNKRRFSLFRKKRKE
jgi:drug/metabolite transporter (DMT)-like permease